MPVKLVMTSCKAVTDVIAVNGVDKELFTQFHDYKIPAGQLEAFRADKSGALVGERIAARQKWKVGELVRLKELGDISFTVQGIFSTGGSAEDFVVLVGRQYLQECAGKQGESNRMLIRLKPGSNAEAVMEAINALPLPPPPRITQAESSFVKANVDQLEDLVRLSKVVVAVVTFVILIAMGNVISMATRERSREFGILRTLGFGKGAILSVVMAEGFLQSLFGAVVGCLVVQGALWANIIRSVSSCGLTVSLMAGPGVWLLSAALVCLAGLLGSVSPAWQASRLNIVAAIRRED